MNDLRFLLPILFIVHWTIENIKATATTNGDWTSWSGCSVTCEDGVQTRTSSCQQSEPVAALCIGSRTESQTCHTGVSCPVTVYVGSEYTLLYGGSVANGNTYKWQKQKGRYGFIDITYNSRYSGITSPGMTITDIQLSDAGTYACVVNPTTVPTMSIPIMLQVETKPVVNGNWGYWSSWSVCSVTCAIGTQFRVRLCNNPEPSDGGSFCIGTHTESQTCNSGVVCPVNGIWGDWTSWSDCSVTCNTGQQTKTRLCNNPPPTNGGSDCSGFGTESQSCNPGVACPVNGIWEDWTSWSDCSVTCNTGQQTKTRLCNNPPPTNGGSDCSGFGTESQSCNPGVACPVNGIWGDWTSWSDCSVTCNTGQQTKTRLCNNPPPTNGGSDCSGFGTESQSCNPGVACPVNGIWEDWTSWSDCSVTCNTGQQTKTRLCNNPPPTNGGSDCSGFGTESQSCNPGVACPVNGIWGDWTSWSDCSVTCNTGQQTKTRLCNNPPPTNGGSDCSGFGTESQSCNPGVACPVNGIWEDWTSWSDCSVTCNTGQQTKTRLCNNPPPTNGGSDCSGFGTESQSCNPGVACPVNGIWGDWTSWSDCSVTCNTGQQTKTRLCNNPPPTNGGSDCSGFGTESQSCYPGVACPVDGDWSNWSEWTMCSTSCGGGYWTRYRNCSNPTPLHGGRVCSGNDLEVDPCSAQSCPVSPSTTNGKSQIATIGGIVAAAVVLLFIIGVMFLLYKRRIKKNCSSTKRVLKQKEKAASSRHVYSNDMVNKRNSFPKLEQTSTNGIHSTEDGYINLQISSVGSSKDYVYCEINPSTTY